ncbi:MAG TPA: hypothetical protein VG097_19380, partial [Gemmata sp.]|nr:hypothetical protein [Gemmata sp.]
MPKTTPEQNKAIVLKAFDTLFNKRDYAAAERFWSPNYVQHIAPRQEELFLLPPPASQSQMSAGIRSACGIAQGEWRTKPNFFGGG